MTRKTVITERALLGRINRRLAHEDEVLRKTRPFFDQGRPFFPSDLGEFYVVDLRRNAI